VRLTADTRPLSSGRVLTGLPERLLSQSPQVEITTATEWGSVIIAQAGARDTPRASSAPLLIYPSLILSCRTNFTLSRAKTVDMPPRATVVPGAG
jgi:hypothetical protein